MIPYVGVEEIQMGLQSMVSIKFFVYSSLEGATKLKFEPFYVLLLRCPFQWYPFFCRSQFLAENQGL